MAEFYFDSKIQVLKNELKLLEDKDSLPQLYFENTSPRKGCSAPCGIGA